MKKASLNLSVNAIVVLILAITMLGLALGFINMVFSQADDLTTGKIDQLREKDLQTLKESCDEEICLEKSTLKLKKNDQEDIFLVINNRFDCDYEASIEVGGMPGGSDNLDDCRIVGSDDAKCDDVTIETLEAQFVEQKTKQHVILRTNVKNTAKNTIYSYDVTVGGDCDYNGQNFNFNKRKVLTVDVQG